MKLPASFGLYSNLLGFDFVVVLLTAILLPKMYRCFDSAPIGHAWDLH